MSAKVPNHPGSPSSTELAPSSKPLLYPFLKDLGLGRLPGDIVIKKENSSFYFPIVTCIVVSVVISLIFMFLKK